MIRTTRHIKVFYQILFFVFIASCGNSKSIQPPQKNSKIPFKETFHQANSEKMIGHFESAIELFNKCLVLDPNSAASHFALAQIYKQQQNTEKAIEYGKNAFNIDADNKWYTAFLADIYFNMGDYHNSANYYQTLIDKHLDRNIDNQSKLAQSYIYSNQKEKAIKTLDRMELELGVTPMTSLTKHDLYTELGKPKLASASLQQLIEENPVNVEVGLEAMDYFLQTRQYDKAEITIHHLKKIDTSNVFAKLGEAEVKLAKGNLADAFSLLSQSLPSQDIEEDRKLMILESLMGMGFDERYPEANDVKDKVGNLMARLENNHTESGKFMSLYGRFLMQNKQQNEATKYFKKAVELDKNDYGAWMNLLDAYYAAENYQNLVSNAENALTVFPNQPMIYLLKGIGEYEQKTYTKADETFFTGQQLVIDDKELMAEFNYHLAKNKWQQNEKKKAAEQFEVLLKNSPANARFFYGYAQLLFDDGNKSKAVHYAKKAADIDQQAPKYAFFYANLLIEEKNYELAQKMIERALNLDLDNPAYLERYGDVMFFMNYTDKAVDIWKQTNTIKPSPRLQQKINSKSYHD